MRAGVGGQRRKYAVALFAYLWRLRFLIIIHECGERKIESISTKPPSRSKNEK